MISVTTGIDIVEVKRFRKIPFKNNNNFYMKNFDSEEIEYCLKFHISTYLNCLYDKCPTCSFLQLRLQVDVVVERLDYGYSKII